MELNEWENWLRLEIQTNVDLVKSYLNRGDTFVDVGANTGLFSKMILDDLGYDFLENVILFEPVPYLVSECKKYFKAQDSYIEWSVPSEALEMEEEKIKLGSFVANQIIFCEGPMAAINPLWSDLKFRLVKGEILDGSCSLTIDHVVSKGIFMLPYKNYLRVGSTYDNHNQNEEPTEKGSRELLNRLSKLYSGNLRVLKG